MRHTLLVLGLAALVLPACAGKPAPSDTAANTAPQKKEKPKYVTMEEMYESQDELMKGPGLFSGEKGYFTIYSKEAPGSADPTKPVKVRRERR
jgi:hypothetical protein